jgi:hypothetical protein
VVRSEPLIILVSPPIRLAKLWFWPPFRPLFMVVLVCSLMFTAVRIPYE